MQSKKNFQFLALTIFSLSAINSFADSESEKYPKSIIERKNEEIGSIFNNNGFKLEFPQKEKRNKTKKVDNYKALWQAAIGHLSPRPFILSDYNSGSIITDWYQEGQQEIKITVLIHSKEIKPNALTVKVYSRVAVKNIRKNNNNPEHEEHELEAQIAQEILANALEITKKAK